MFVALCLVAYCIGLCHKMQQSKAVPSLSLYPLCIYIYIYISDLARLYDTASHAHSPREASQTGSFTFATFGCLQARTLWLHLPKNGDEDQILAVNKELTDTPTEWTTK